MMFLIVRVFFTLILVSVILSMALGWFAIARARMHLGKAFGKPPEPRNEKPTNVIEGEYRVLEDDDKNGRS